MKKLSLLLLALFFVLGSLPVIASDLTGANKTVKRVDTTCVVRAVTTRETAVLGAYNQMSKKISNALIIRSSEIANAWTITDTKMRRAAIAKAWSKYGATKKEAVKSYRSSIANIWKTFRAAIKSCKLDGKATNSQADEPNGEKGDSSLE